MTTTKFEEEDLKRLREEPTKPEPYDFEPICDYSMPRIYKNLQKYFCQECLNKPLCNNDPCTRSAAAVSRLWEVELI